MKTLTSKETEYIKILTQIALERDMRDLALYIEKYGEEPVEKSLPPLEVQTPDYSGLSDKFTKPKYNITAMPEASCDGCQ